MQYAIEAGTPYATAVGDTDPKNPWYWVVIVAGITGVIVGAYRNYRQARRRQTAVGNVTAQVFIQRPFGMTQVVYRVMP